MKSHGSAFMMVSVDFNDRCLSWTDNHCGSNLGQISSIYQLYAILHNL